jgi:hypothetical protein
MVMVMVMVLAASLAKDALTASIAQLVQAGHSVTVSSISDEELNTNPGLLKSMSVSLPRGSGSVRVFRIGDAQKLIDLQPYDGTHVQNTAEIGAMVVTKIKKISHKALCGAGVCLKAPGTDWKFKRMRPSIAGIWGHSKATDQSGYVIWRLDRRGKIPPCCNLNS